MQRWRRFKPIVLWIALWAMLSAALAPAMAQVAPGHGARPQGVVCTMMTPLQMAAADHPSPGQSAPAHVLEHCPYCAMHAAALGAPLAVPQFVAVVLPEAPQLANAAVPRMATRWPDRQSRGPPGS